MQPEQTIPVIDLGDFISGEAERRECFVQRAGEALENLGFFAVENHGVDAQLVKDAYGAARKFFELDESARRAHEDPVLKGQRGYTSFGREHAKDSAAPDLKEFWHVGRELDPDHDLYDVYPKNIWPSEVPAFRRLMTALYRQLDACANALLRACALYLDVPETTFSDMAEDGNTILRVLHYPPVEPDVNPASIRAAAHEDINLITLLCESTDDGLELRTKDGSWIPVHALDGQIIVDSGDMLQNATNGIFKSTTHRVVNPANDGRRRFSMPFFVHPRSEVDLSPLPRCVHRSGRSSSYPTITAGEYLHQRLAEIGLG